MLKEEWMVYYSLPSYIGYIVVISQRLKEALRISKAENFFNLRQCIHNVCIEFLYREIEKKK